MISSIRHRIEKLEALNTRLVHRIIWEDGTAAVNKLSPGVEASYPSDLTDEEFVGRPGFSLDCDAHRSTGESLSKAEAAWLH